MGPMSILVKRPDPGPPYSLHDAYILELRIEGDALRLVTQYGYTKTTEPFGQVQGDVEITGIDWDSSHVYVMEYRGVLCGNCGPFTGRKMAVEDFLKTYPQGTLDVMDETYGYHQMKLGGFLNVGERCLEFWLDLCYNGEFRYLLRN